MIFGGSHSNGGMKDCISAYSSPRRYAMHKAGLGGFFLIAYLLAYLFNVIFSGKIKEDLKTSGRAAPWMKSRSKS